MARKRTAKATRKTSRKTTRRTTTRSSSKTTANPKLLEQQQSPWERIKKLGYSHPHLYDLPWEARGMATMIGATNLPGIGYITEGRASLAAPFEVKPYSWAAYCLDRATGSHQEHPPKHPERYTLRTDQIEDSRTIIDAKNQGSPEFLVANGTGTGKTVTTWATVLEINPKNVLIVCPAAVIPVWRQHIVDMGDKGIRVVIINYESLKKLVQPPQSAITAKKTSTQNKNIALHGTPYENFDLVIFDEAHKLKNPTSQQSRIANMLSAHAEFIIRLTATPGKDPSQLHHLWRGMSWKTGSLVSVKDDNDFSAYVRWCQKQGIHGIVPAPFGNGITWEGDRDDLVNMERILYSDGGGRKLGIRRIPDDWEKVIRQPLLVELSPEDQSSYQSVIDDVRRQVLEGYSLGRKDPAKGLAALVAFRQKTGMLKAKTVVDYTKYCIQDMDEQVVISSIFYNTTDTISDLLHDAGIDHVVITGELSAEEKEENRRAFQRGDVPVVITSITTGISLHSGEDATGASMNKRRMIIADTHWSPIEHTQLEGRINRNGQSGVVTIPYIPDTIDEKVTRTLLAGLESQSVIQGSDQEDDLKVLADALGISLGS